MSGKKQRELLQRKLGQHCGQMSKARREEEAQRMARVQTKEQTAPIVSKPTEKR